MKKEVITILCLAIFTLGDISIVYGYPPSPPSGVDTWRWRSDNGDVYTATWMDSAETPIVLGDAENLRLRMALKYQYTDTTRLSLAYCEDSCDGGWIRITTLDSGKFFISQSDYLSDAVTYFDNELLVPNIRADSGFAYLKTIVFDSTDIWPIAGQGNSINELEYCLRATARVKSHSAYFFSLLDDTGSVVNAWQGGCSFPVIMSSPVGWNTQSSGTGVSLFGVSFVDRMVGTAVGDAGTIIRTTDGGTTWAFQSSGSTECLTDVFFLDANTGFVVGDLGTILHTSDGGNTWESKAVFTATFLRALCFTDAKTGTVVGLSGSILHTTNGGDSWSWQSGGKSYDLLAVDFFDRNLGIAVGTAGTILRTTDAGVHWSPEMSGVSDSIVSVLVSEEKTATAVARDGVILRSTDGGITWVKKTGGSGRYLTSAEFIDADRIVGVGGLGLILRTTGSTSAWQRLVSCSSQFLNAVDFVDASNGWIVGHRGTILKTTNGGAMEVHQRSNPMVPEEFALSQNYPNPFNPMTTISYYLPAECFVSLKVYDVLGREVATLVNEVRKVGRYNVKFDASTLPSGAYFYRIMAGRYLAVKKMLVLK